MEVPVGYLIRSDDKVTQNALDSVIEAMYAGRPHLILAAWFDLYTLAARAEWLGCGLQANKGVEPSISGPLLADALVTVLRDREGEEGARIKSRAEELGRLCRVKRGDQVAAEAIVQAALGSREAAVPSLC
jgi:UDP:flavonoid glycosyltransferase YjiC (YdhE family)